MLVEVPCVNISHGFFFGESILLSVISSFQETLYFFYHRLLQCIYQRRHHQGGEEHSPQPTTPLLSSEYSLQQSPTTSPTVSPSGAGVSPLDWQSSQASLLLLEPSSSRTLRAVLSFEAIQIGLEPHCSISVDQMPTSMPSSRILSLPWMRRIRMKRVHSRGYLANSTGST